jgi:hypothetical protein
MLQKKLLASSSDDLKEKSLLLYGTLILKNRPENSITISQLGVNVRREQNHPRPSLI